MRPGEVNYADRRAHFLDVSNGEILAGRADRSQYIMAGADPNNVHNLGEVLHEEPGTIPWTSDERLNTRDWPDEKYLEFGRWLYSVAAKPDDPRRFKLNTNVFKNARQIGIAPSIVTIRRIFGSQTAFYREIKAADTKKNGLFDDWDINDFVAYIKSVGGDTRPTGKKFEHRKNGTAPRQKPVPDFQYMSLRFREIGGFTKLLELAGYPVIKLWDDPDYIDWGVRFMQANDGEVPTTRSIRYLSAKKRAPSPTTIVTKFGMNSFQDEVIEEWKRVEAEREEQEQEKLTAIRTELRQKRLNPELFTPVKYDPVMSAHNGLPIGEFLDLPALASRSVAIVGAEVLMRSNPREAIRRYAEFKVLTALIPDMSYDSKIQICKRIGIHKGARSFMPCVTRYMSKRKNPDARKSIRAGDVEYQALVFDMFDDIWPMDDHMQTLRLGDDYVRPLRKNKRTNGYKQSERVGVTSF